MDPLVLAALALVAGLAGWVDAIAGGGGLLQMPALFLAGVPTPALFGVNKVSSISGTSAALARYGRHGSVRWGVVAVAGPLALAASFGGTFVLLAAAKAAADWIRPVFACLFVALAVHQARRALRPAAMAGTGERRSRLGVGLAFVGLIGAYDGCVGPGTGMFLFWAFTTWLGLPALAATGTTKAVNWMTNAGSLVALLGQGHIQWPPALAMASMNLLGGFLGARMAIRRGVAFIRLVTAAASLLAALYLLVQWGLARGS